MSATTTITPEVGTLATQGFGSDCYPMIVTGVNPSGTKIVVSGLGCKPAPGVNVYQQWASVKDGTLIVTDTPEPGTGATYSLRRNGRWVRQGQDMKTGQRVSLGDARYHQDPHF